MNAEQIIAIIKRRLAECDDARAKYDELELTSHAPRETLNRKRYQIDGIEIALKAILDEIEQAKEERHKNSNE
jgi:hypothetical protein